MSVIAARSEEISPTMIRVQDSPNLLGPDGEPYRRPGSSVRGQSSRPIPPPSTKKLTKEEYRQRYDSLLNKARDVATEWDESVFVPLMKNLMEFGGKGGVSAKNLAQERKALFRKFVMGHLVGAEKFYQTYGSPGMNPKMAVPLNSYVKTARKYAADAGISPKEFKKLLEPIIEAARKANQEKAQEHLRKGLAAVVGGVMEAIISGEGRKIHEGNQKAARHFEQSLQYYLAE